MPLNRYMKSPSSSNDRKRVVANRYEITQKLGAGQFGTAFLCSDRKEEAKNCLKVLKEIPVGGLQPNETVVAEHEARLLSQLSHPNIVKFLGKFIDREFFCIITEYCEGGDLDKYIEGCQKKKQPISEKRVLDWFVQLLLGVDYIHARRILHRDLKSRNIFLQNERIKIGDFGISRILMGPSDYASTFIGTPYYMSPEVLKHEGYNSKSDIWSLGCILFDMCALKHAFESTSFLSVLYKITDDDPPSLPSHYPIQMDMIFKLMLQKAQKDRPSAGDILKMPFIVDHITKMSEECKNNFTFNSQCGEKEVTEIHRKLSEKCSLENLRKRDEYNRMKHLTPRQRLHLQKQEDADRKAERVKEEIRLQQLKNKKRNETIKEVKRKIYVPAFQGGDGEGEALQKALTVTVETDTQKNTEIHIMDSSISWDSLDWSLTPTSGVANFNPDDRPITPLHKTFSSGQNLYNDFEDGIPTTPQLAETYYIDDFEPDRDDEADETVKPLQTVNGDETNQDMEMFLGYLQSALNGPDQDNDSTLTIDNTGAFGPKARNNKIKSLRRECISALGEEIFKQVYQYLKQVHHEKMNDSSLSLEEMKGLEEILQKSNNGMLVEQLLFLEEQESS